MLVSFLPYGVSYYLNKDPQCPTVQSLTLCLCTYADGTGQFLPRLWRGTVFGHHYLFSGPTTDWLMHGKL